MTVSNEHSVILCTVMKAVLFTVTWSEMKALIFFLIALCPKKVYPLYAQRNLLCL